MLLADGNSTSDGIKRFNDLKASLVKSLKSGENDLLDPTLPLFHTGESSLGPLDGLNFELSNQGDVKPSDQFSLT